MHHSQRVLLLTTVAMVACAQPMLSEPVVASTGMARSNDGYEASIAAAEAGGYPIIVNDEKNAFVRVRSRNSLGSDVSSSVYLDLKAWKGSVDVKITMPQGLTLDEPRLGRVLSERKELAWAVATRARLIAGEPISGNGSVPGDVGSYPGIGKPTTAPNSSWTLP